MCLIFQCLNFSALRSFRSFVWFVTCSWAGNLAETCQPWLMKLPHTLWHGWQETHLLLNIDVYKTTQNKLLDDHVVDSWQYITGLPEKEKEITKQEAIKRIKCNSLFMVKSLCCSTVRMKWAKVMSLKFTGDWWTYNYLLWPFNSST